MYHLVKWPICPLTRSIFVKKSFVHFWSPYYIIISPPCARSRDRRVIKNSCFCKNGNMCMCVWYEGDMMEIVCVAWVDAKLCFWVAYVLPKCRFISVSANFGQTLDLYVLFLGKAMPNFCMTLMHAHIFIINLFYYYCADVHDGQWNDGGQVVAVGGAGHERK